MCSMFLLFVFDFITATPEQGGGRGRGKASRDDEDSDFEDAPKKKAPKSKAKVLPPPPLPTRAVVPELVEAESGGKVRSFFLAIFQQFNRAFSWPLLCRVFIPFTPEYNRNRLLNLTCRGQGKGFGASCAQYRPACDGGRQRRNCATFVLVLSNLIV